MASELLDANRLDCGLICSVFLVWQEKDNADTVAIDNSNFFMIVF